MQDDNRSRGYIPSLDSLDAEFGGEYEIAPEHDGERHRRLLPSIRALLAMVVLGVLLAFLWRNIGPQLWSATQVSPSIASPWTASTSSAAISTGQLAEIDTLKKTISELRESQQHMTATIAFLRAAQHEFQQKPAHWYSDPKALTQPTAAAVSHARLLKQKSTTRSRPEPQDANVTRRDPGAPVPLVSARP